MLFHSILLMSSFNEVQKEKECKLRRCSFLYFPPSSGNFKTLRANDSLLCFVFLRGMLHLTVFDRR